MPDHGDLARAAAEEVARLVDEKTNLRFGDEWSRDAFPHIEVEYTTDDIAAIFERHWHEQQEEWCDGCKNSDCSQNQPDHSHDY